MLLNSELIAKPPELLRETDCDHQPLRKISSYDRKCADKCQKRSQLQVQEREFKKRGKAKMDIKHAQKEGNEEIQLLKTNLKNILMRMKYKEKLSQIEILIEEAKALSIRFGFFYVTCAMIVYDPQNQVKLSLWVHPDLLQNRCIHPIKENTKQQEETKFYASLKAVLRELFPTISMGEGQSYFTLLRHVKKLQVDLEERLRIASLNCSRTASNQLNQRNESNGKEKAINSGKLRKMISLGEIKFYKREEKAIDQKSKQQKDNSCESLRSTKYSEGWIEIRRQDEEEKGEKTERKGKILLHQ